MKETAIIIRNVIFTDKNGICWKIKCPKECEENEFFKNIEEQFFKEDKK
jgi:hypothetical protein